jgi:hypothetical protein
MVNWRGWKRECVLSQRPMCTEALRPQELSIWKWRAKVNEHTVKGSTKNRAGKKIMTEP